MRASACGPLWYTDAFQIEQEGFDDGRCGQAHVGDRKQMAWHWVIQAGRDALWLFLLGDALWLFLLGDAVRPFLLGDAVWLFLLGDALWSKYLVLQQYLSIPCCNAWVSMNSGDGVAPTLHAMPELYCKQVKIMQGRHST